MRVKPIEVSVIDVDKAEEGVPQGGYVAVYHGLVRLFSRRANLDRVKIVAKIARARGARTLVLPPYFNTGPILEYSSISRRRYIARLFEQITGSSIEALRGIALTERIDIIVPCFLEKAGAHHYITATAILKDGSVVGKYRKILVSDREYLYGVRQGRKLVVFRTSRLSYGVAINNEVFAPEICRGLRALGVSVIIAPLNPLDFKYKAAYIVGRTRAIENSISMLFVGGIVEYHDEVVSAAPTVMFKDTGDPVFEYNENKPALILLSLKRFADKDDETIYSVALIYRLNKILSSVLRKSRREFVEKIYRYAYMEEEAGIEEEGEGIER